MLDNYLIMHGQFSKKYIAKYNIVENKIKIRSDCLCIVNIDLNIHLNIMNVWQIAKVHLITIILRNVTLHAAIFFHRDLATTRTMLTQYQQHTHLWHLIISVAFWIVVFGIFLVIENAEDWEWIICTVALAANSANKHV